MAQRDGLTIQQRKFCNEYIKTGNGTQSAIKAGYSPKTARTLASQLLTNLNVQEYINSRTAKSEAKDIADAEEVLRYFTGVMRGEIKDQFDLDASLQERTKAAIELAKRFVDHQDKITGANGITIINNIPKPE